MNTRPIPIVLALLAAGSTCILSIVQHVTFGVFLLRLFLVSLIFYVIGIVVGILLIMALGPEKKPGEDEASENSETETSDEGNEEGEEKEELENVTDEDVNGGSEDENVDENAFMDDEDEE